VITRFNGAPIRNELDIREAVARAVPGQKAQITVMRAGKEQVLTAVIEQAPGEKVVGAAAAQTQSRLGVQVADVTPEITRQLGLDTSFKGVVITAVQPGSPAAEAGMQPGDALLRIGSQTIETAAQVPEIVKSLKSGDTTSIVVRREKSRILLRVILE
jgi:serine protease Do